MIKKIRSILVINLLGLLMLFLVLFGYQGFKPINDSTTHFSIVIDENVLKGKLDRYTTKDLKEMLAAGIKVEKWMGILEKSGTNIVEKVLKGQGVFSRMAHYPIRDTFDEKTYSQYYYHAHRGGEHGHFHLFLRQGGIKKGMVPLVYDERSEPFDTTDTFAHLIAISMDGEGYPLSFFTINRWVTGEDWYKAIDLKKMVRRFNVEHAHPSYVVNRWLKAMLILFKPQIDTLIDQRDEKLMEWGKGRALKTLLDDQELEVISEEPISIDTQVRVIRALLKEREVLG